MDASRDELHQLRIRFSPLLDDGVFEHVNHGESGARVLRLMTPGSDGAFLKYAFGAAADEIREEHARLAWLGTRAPAPRVLSYVSDADGAFLLTEALAGRNALDAAATDPAAVVVEMARALRELHSIPPADCPFEQRLETRLGLAHDRMRAGLVDEDAFDEVRQRLTAQALHDRLLARKPAMEDLVVVHGDACPENLIVSNGRFMGFVDCGRLGLADRYQDLALASRNIESALGPRFSERFFSEYGEPTPDPDKLDYYRTLDEFF